MALKYQINFQPMLKGVKKAGTETGVSQSHATPPDLNCKALNLPGVPPWLSDLSEAKERKFCEGFNNSEIPSDGQDDIDYIFSSLF